MQDKIMDFPRIEGMSERIIFDSHAHYDDKKFDECRDELLEFLPQYGVCGVITCGCDGESSKSAIKLAEKYDYICTCGPKPMMMAVARYARENGIACEVSLENKMACGLGACLCCVEDTKEGHKCVCTDGPVFSIDELKW